VTTTPRGSRVGLRIAHLLSTLIVCGGLALLVSPPPSYQGVFDSAAFAWDASAGETRGLQWVSGALETDPPDSDDDDDDGPDGSNAIILSGPCAVTINLQTHPPFDRHFTPAFSLVPRDSHSLRAPPR
jgi:hypothetical protein